ncbi:MAG TPA: hypothetical protein VLB09_02190 [Nitrospiria bacterium]|nr:hypothetical protein [Nitrospiria bacterium]
MLEFALLQTAKAKLTTQPKHLTAHPGSFSSHVHDLGYALGLREFHPFKPVRIISPRSFGSKAVLLSKERPDLHKPTHDLEECRRTEIPRA